MNLSLVQGRWEVSSEVCWPGVGMMWPSLMFVQEKEGSEDRGGCIRQGMCFLTIYFFVTGAFFYGWLSFGNPHFKPLENERSHQIVGYIPAPIPVSSVPRRRSG